MWQNHLISGLSWCTPLSAAQILNCLTYSLVVPVIHSIIILLRAFPSLSTTKNDVLKVVLKSFQVSKFPRFIEYCQKLAFQCFAVPSLMKDKAKMIFQWSSGYILLFIEMNISTSIIQSSSLLRSPVNSVGLFILTSCTSAAKEGGASSICSGPGAGGGPRGGGPRGGGPPGGGGGGGGGGAGRGAAGGTVGVLVGCTPAMLVWVMVWVAIIIREIGVAGVIRIGRVIMLK